MSAVLFWTKSFVKKGKEGSEHKQTKEQTKEQTNKPTKKQCFSVSGRSVVWNWINNEPLLLLLLLLPEVPDVSFHWRDPSETTKEGNNLQETDLMSCHGFFFKRKVKSWKLNSIFWGVELNWSISGLHNLRTRLQNLFGWRIFTFILFSKNHLNHELEVNGVLLGSNEWCLELEQLTASSFDYNSLGRALWVETPRYKTVRFNSCEDFFFYECEL